MVCDSNNLHHNAIYPQPHTYSQTHPHTCHTAPTRPPPRFSYQAHLLLCANRLPDVCNVNFALFFSIYTNICTLTPPRPFDNTSMPWAYGVYMQIMPNCWRAVCNEAVLHVLESSTRRSWLFHSIQNMPEIHRKPNFGERRILILPMCCSRSRRRTWRLRGGACHGTERVFGLMLHF